MIRSELSQRPYTAAAERRPRILTYGLLAVLLAIFAGEYIFRVGPVSGPLNPSITTLIALGALDKTAVTADGEWWRLFSAPLLHGGLPHIALNGVALFFAGAVLENVIGRAWFAAIFAVAGVCGAALSLAINPPTLISVGASGAIMGLFAAAFAVSFRYPAPRQYVASCSRARCASLSHRCSRFSTGCTARRSTTQPILAAPPAV